MNNPDYRMYPHIYNVLTQKGQHMPGYFDLLIDPYDKEESVRAAEESLSRITVPTYTGSGWYAYTYKTHLNGAQNYFEKIPAPKKLLFVGPAHLERPFHTLNREILRWHDYWLKGIDTGVMDEPAVRYWVMGANEWRSANDWPPPEVQWIKFYLASWERLRTEPFVPGSAEDALPPDAFVQMPPTQTNVVQRLRYMTDPLPHDVLVAGPSVLYLYAEIDQDDTNWFVALKDIGPDHGVRTVREGERELPSGLLEREVTRGWLKASHRALDPTRSKPWKPWHPLTRAAQKKVVPGEINEYAIEIMATANLFRRGHRICIEIAAADMPTGVAGATNAEYIPNHICSSRTTLHKIYHDARRPSHLLLPILPC
jgi:predicted acyl esterase